jgi:hypothetical protein
MIDVMQELGKASTNPSKASLTSEMFSELKAGIGPDPGISTRLKAVETLRQHEMFYEFPLEQFDDNLVNTMVNKLSKKELIRCGLSKNQLKFLAKFRLKKARMADAGDKEGKLRADGAFCSTGVKRPKRFACDGMLLDFKVDIITDPVAFLNDCLNKENVDNYNAWCGKIKQHLETAESELSEDKRKALLLELNAMSEILISSPLIDKSAQTSLRDAMLRTELPKKTNTYGMVADLLDEAPPNHTSKPNLASLMKKHNLRTLCSVSGPQRT